MEPTTLNDILTRTLRADPGATIRIENYEGAKGELERVETRDDGTHLIVTVDVARTPNIAEAVARALAAELAVDLVGV